MLLVKGLVGFFVGAAAGLVFLSLISPYLPQIQGVDASKEEAVVTLDPATTPVEGKLDVAKASEPEATTVLVEPKIEEIQKTDEAPKVETSPEIEAPNESVEAPKQIIAAPKEEVASVEPEQPVPAVMTVAPEPSPETVVDELATKAPAALEPDTSADPTPAVQPDVSPEPAEESEVAILTLEPDVVEEPKKFNLPTIDAREPEAAQEPVIPKVEPTPEPELGITIGKKPKSSLPSITSEGPESDDNAAEADEQTARNEALAARAIELNATGFKGSDRPLLGVILLDIGDKGLAVEKLKSLNAPITIAISTDDPNASERALEYNAAGFEIIIMVTDNQGSALNTAKNSEHIKNALDIMFNNIPNAIGLLDSAQGNIQKKSRIAATLVDSFVDSGHGLITYAKGLNSVDRTASAAGVRTAKVSRTLDANSENKAVINRYLDRVALDAGRDGAAIVLGTTTKSTVAALAGWVLSSKGQSIALAPASAVLLGK